MVQITVELIRKRAEHNENEIRTLEELSLHQENIEKIDILQNVCKNLQILLLQSNLINRIENLGKLKRLRYLNLALNNIECVENLERLESLEKLDLTLNFIGDVESITKLQANLNLKNLILTGNPCSDFNNYREYIITILPQIHELDSREITRSERLVAQQDFENKTKVILQDQTRYFKKRLKEKQEVRSSVENESDELFWNKPSKNTPEERIEIARRAEASREKGKNTDKKVEKRETRLFNKDGRPLNINQPKIPFRLYDDESGQFIILNIAVYRYLETSYITVDIQPTYVTVNIKGKIFQIVLSDEINISESTCKRSQTTGHMEIRMPRINFIPIKRSDKKPIKVEKGVESKSCFLDIRESKNVLSIIKQEDWIDDTSVPPLE